MDKLQTTERTFIQTMKKMTQIVLQRPLKFFEIHISILTELKYPIFLILDGSKNTLHAVSCIG